MATLLYGCTAVLFWQPARGRRMAAVVFWIYAVVCGAGAAALVYLPGDFLPPRLLPLLHVYASVLLLTLPIYWFREGRICTILYPKRRAFFSLAYGVAVVSLVGNLIYLVGVAGDIGAHLRGALSFDMAYAEKSQDAFQKTGLSIVNIPIVLGSAVGDLPLFLLLCMLTVRKHLVLKCALGACTALPLVVGVAQAGRNSLIFFSIAACGTTLLFWPMLPTSTRRRLVYGGTVVTALFVIAVLMITVSRFRTQSDMTPGESLLIYAGQPMLHFSEYIYEAKTTCNGDMNFALFRAVLGLEFSSTLPIRNRTWEVVLGVPLGVFYTFLGNWILDFGNFMTAVLILVVFVAASSLTRHRDGCACLHQFFLIYILFKVVAQGVFYYQHTDIGGNLQMIFMVCCYLLFRFTTVAPVDATRRRG